MTAMLSDEPLALQQAHPSDRPELVFALVVPVGTSVRDLKGALKNELDSYGYHPETLRVSDLLIEYARSHDLPYQPSSEDVRIQQLMDAGDSLCASRSNSAAVFRETLKQMGARRHVLYQSGESADTDKKPIAWIVDSLKRKAEVESLRYVFGDRAIVVGAQASDETRVKALLAKIQPKRPTETAQTTKDIVDALVARDKEGAAQEFGQDILRTFPLADCFIDCEKDPRKQVERLLQLLFRTPEAPRPTDDEYGMFVATVTSTLSPELGRRVGAAILEEGSVVSTGTNSHPTETGQPTHDPSKGDIAMLVLDTLKRLPKGTILHQDAVERLSSEPAVLVAELLSGDLSESQLAALTEFQRPVHAEMSALLDALKQSKSVKDAKIYVTTFPCHGCAKHLLRLGLKGFYIEPYPKGRAEAMYGHDVTDAIIPFTGIAPRLYMRVFDSSARRAGQDGALLGWDPEDRAKAMPAVSTFVDDEVIQSRAAFELDQHGSDEQQVG